MTKRWQVRALLLFLAGMQTTMAPAQVTPTAPDAGKSKIHLGEDLQLKKAEDLRQAVAKQLQALRFQYEIHRRIQEGLTQGGNGTQDETAKVHVVMANMASNRAAMFAPTSELLETYGFKLRTDALRTDSLAAAGRSKLGQTQTRIDQLADEVVAARDRLKGLSKDAPAARELEDEINAKQVEINDRLQLRDDVAGQLRRYEEIARVDHQEIEGVRGLERQLDQLANREKVFLERLANAIESHSTEVLRDARRPLREGLDLAVGWLKEPLPAVEFPSPPAPNGDKIPLWPLVDRSKRRLADIDQTRVEEELKTANQRRQKPVPAP